MASLILLTAEPENWVPKQLAEKAKTAGFDVEVVNPDEAYISLAQDTYISHGGTKFNGADICITRLSEENLEYKIAIIDHLQKMGVKVLNSGKSLRAASNKVESQILLNNVAINTPRTAVFTNVDQLEVAVKAIGDGEEKFPIIIKTIYGTHGVGVIRADSMASAKSIVQQLLKSGEQFMVQEYIEHEQSARILMLDGKPLAAVMRAIPPNDFRSNAHQGAELTAYDPTDSEIQIAKSACEALEINFAAVDYILKDKEIIVLEVNGSPGFQEMQKVTELDIANAVIEFCSALSIAKDKPEEEEAEEVKHVDIDREDAEELDKVKKDGEEIITPPEVVDLSNEKSSENEMTTHNKDEDNIVGTVTAVTIKHFNDENPIEARVDTGAHISCINGSDIEIEGTSVKFKFNDTIYKFHLLRMAKIKQADNEEGVGERPVIRVDIVINGNTLRNVEMTVNERGHMKYAILLGRQTLAAAGVLVNPAANIIDAENAYTGKKEEE